MSSNPSATTDLGSNEPVGLYDGSRAITVQGYTEANAKNGVEHELSLYLPAFAGSSTNETIFLTGSSPVILKSRRASYTGTGVMLGINEGATYTGGSDLPSYNLSRINPVTPIAKFIGGATITDPGVQAFPEEYVIGNESNQGKGGTSDIEGRERILKPNTVYNFIITSLDSQAQDVFVFDSWYEGDPDFPINP